MTVEQIIEMYGKNTDYYDQVSGRIYHISQMEYHLFDNSTYVPVSEFGEMIGIVKLKGNWTI
jgi:hypothetical protein